MNNRGKPLLQVWKRAERSQKHYKSKQCRSDFWKHYFSNHSWRVNVESKC